MSDDEKLANESGMPDGIPAPPPPKPNIVDPSADQATYGGSKSSDKKKGRHPSDPYEPLKKRKGCGGCCGCLAGIGALVVILLVAISAAVYYVGPGRYIVKERYEPVTFLEPTTTISEAPDKATIYIGKNIIYNAPMTDVPIAIFGSEVSVDGDFTENVSLTGAKVTGEATARFAKDLKVFAAEFYDKGISLKGTLTGRVMKSLK